MVGIRYDDAGRFEAGYKGNAGDCLCRALTVFSGIEYQSVYDSIAATLKSYGYPKTANMYTANRAFGAYGRKTKITKALGAICREIMEDWGFSHLKNTLKLDINAVAKAFPDCIVFFKSHAAAIENGILIDTWDSRCLRGRPRIPVSIWVL